MEKKVKSMQMFRRPAKAIRCGDRAGLCLAQLDAAAIERGVVAAPGSVPGLTAVLALVRKVRFFRGRTDTERTFHVTLGHTTTVATAYFFGAAELNDTAVPKFDGEREYVYQEKLDEKLQWCLLKFEAKVRCQLDALVIGSHLESDAAMADACRIAFHGRLVERAEGDAIGEKIRLYKLKRKVGLVAKLGDPCVSTNGDMGVRDVVGKDLFARETNMAQFVGLRIQAETGEVGKLSSAFGKGGKFRVQFEGPTDVQPGGRLYLVYKKYAFSSSKALHQDDDCVVPADELVTPGKPPKKKVVEPPPPPPLSPKKTEDVREGVVERLKGDPLDSGRYRTVIVEGLFSAEEDQKQFVGSMVKFATGDEGVLAGPFGKAGKSKVDVDGAGTDAAVGASVTLRLPAR